MPSADGRQREPESRERSRWPRSSAASSRSHNAQGGSGGGGTARRWGDRGGYGDQASKEAKRPRKLRERGGGGREAAEETARTCVCAEQAAGETEAAAVATPSSRARASGSRGRRAPEVMTVRLRSAASA